VRCMCDVPLSSGECLILRGPNGRFRTEVCDSTRASNVRFRCLSPGNCHSALGQVRLFQTMALLARSAWFAAVHKSAVVKVKRTTYGHRPTDANDPKRTFASTRPVVGLVPGAEVDDIHRIGAAQ
jgi:hypothetical protein